MSQSINNLGTRPMSPQIFSRLPNGADRFYDGQNLLGGTSKVGNPNIATDDATLALDLKNDLQRLDAFTKDGKFTLASLEEIAKEGSRSARVSERIVSLAQEINNRAPLKEAISGKGGVITVEKLTEASETLVDNTNPNTQSDNPFHGKTNLQLATALQGRFDDWRDKSEDINILFGAWKWRYVNLKTITEISQNPHLTDEQGQVKRDPSNGFPLYKYSLDDVHLAKTLIKKPGLLRSLDSNKANGFNPFGSINHDGWLKNTSLDTWIKNERKERET